MRRSFLREERGRHTREREKKRRWGEEKGVRVAPVHIHTYPAYRANNHPRNTTVVFFFFLLVVTG